VGAERRAGSWFGLGGLGFGVGLGFEAAAREVGVVDHAVCVGQPQDGAGGDAFFEEGFEQPLGEEGADLLVEVGVVGGGESGEFEEGGAESEAAGVAVEGGETDALVFEVEGIEEGAVGGRGAVDDGAVELAAGGRVEFVEEGGAGVEVGEGRWRDCGLQISDCGLVTGVSRRAVGGRCRKDRAFGRS
jgi:hypothetical protein